MYGSGQNSLAGRAVEQGRHPTHCIQHLKGQYQKVQYQRHPHPKLSHQPSPIQAILDDEDEDQQPHFKETTHEHTTIQPLERAMRPDSPTHEQRLQEEQKSDHGQQDEISIEQSLADDQDRCPHLISLPQKSLIPIQTGTLRRSPRQKD
eukprot:g39783.t1